MMAPQKVQNLQRLLSTLPVPVARRLAKAIEVDRLTGGEALPHEAILQGLRPHLRGAQGARVAQYYEKGERDGEPVEIPKAVRLACYALSQGIYDYHGPRD